MKPDLKSVLLGSIKRRPGPPCALHIFCDKKKDVEPITAYLANEWGIQNAVGCGTEILIETTIGLASVVLTDLKYAFPRAFVQGWSVPLAAVRPNP